MGTCEICQTNQGTMELTMLENSSLGPTVRKHHYCDDCYKENEEQINDAFNKSVLLEPIRKKK